MGCTSSAPNTIPPNANKADKSIQFEEDSSAKPATEADVAGTEDENKANETTVLPTCDTLEQPVQLVRHNESTTSLQSGKVFHQNGKVIENENTTEPSETTLDEENKSKLEEIVDKVFDMNHIKEMNESDTTDCRINDEATDNKDNENDKSETTSEPEAGDNPENYEENNKEDSENAEEASPSQSQSSRATRWEALADIAAELPPSLAVDPLTGQIYALTK